jgi:transcriptional regulator with XRE-family HTH domain
MGIPALPFCRLVKTVEVRAAGYPEQLISLGDHIRATRLDRHLTQVQAAEQLGVTESTVVNWELGHYGPDLRSIPVVIAWLGYDPRDSGESLSEQIRWLRRTRGLTQREFAGLLGADPSSVSLWELGEVKPGPRYRELLEGLVEAMQNVIVD